jgi:glycosyltransferase involved in cell wall biosynthesis
MRILHVIPSVAPAFGGPSKAVIEMARAVNRRGADSEIYTTNVNLKGVLDVPLGTPVETGGVNITYFPIEASHHYKISLGLASALRSITAAVDLVDIHSLYQFPSTAAAYFARRFGVPYIIRPHGSLDPFLFRRHRLRKILYELGVERHNLAAAARIHFTSDEEMELARKSGIPFKPAVAPLGVDLDETTGDARGGGLCTRWPELRGRRVLLFLGRINFKKGFDILVPAFARLARERGDVHLMIAGPDGDGYGRRVREWLRAEGALDRVTFTGMIEGSDKALALSAATAFVLPSYTENFGIAVVEAMAAGLPVIISNRVNIWREIVAAGAGIATEPNVEDFTAAIGKLLDSPDAAHRMGEAGRELYRRSFTWDSAGARLMDLYETVIREHHDRAGQSSPQSRVA